MKEKNKENSNNKKKINSILKFDYIEKCKSKNIDQYDEENTLELLAVDLFKKKSYEIVLLFSNNGIITLEAEVIETELDNIEKVNDKN